MGLLRLYLERCLPPNRAADPPRLLAGAMTLALLFFSSYLQVQAQTKPYDYLIKNALVFDGDSFEPARQDIAIAGNWILQIGQFSAEDAKQVVDGEGLFAAPGFIDIHTHSDFNPFVYRELGNKVAQGVTTEVIGNCGMSAAPVIDLHKQFMAQVWRREGVETPADIPWQSYADYVSETEYQGLETNFVGLVGHGNIRSAVMGMEPRAAKPDELEAMKKILAESLKEGAYGVSFGLVYLPGVFADHNELVSLCHEAALQDKLCAFHIRSEGKNLTQAIQEAIDIGREAKARVHISHLKAAGQSNWPKIKEAFQLIEKAQAEGLQVSADAYPYTASFAELGVVLPDDLYQYQQRVPYFKDLKKRGKILRDLRKYYTANPRSWDNVRIATVTTPKNSPLQGKSIADITKESGKPPVEVLVNLLAEEEFQVSAFYFSQSPAVLEQVLSKPYVSVGSDSIADGSAMPHPRAYGTFPKMLSFCLPNTDARKNSCWGRTIHQMTALPAQVFGIKKRGRILPGFFADVVLFNPSSVKDGGDYAHPKVKPEGIEWVFVNGKPVIQKGKYAPAQSGLFLEDN